MDLLDEEVDLTPSRHLRSAQPAAVSPRELATRHERVAGLLAELQELLPDLASPEIDEGDTIREATLDELAQSGAVFIRRAVGRSADSHEPTARSPVLTGRDVALGLPPSESGDFPADEFHHPVIRAGDVLIPVVGQRLTARVATGLDVGGRPSPTLYLIRPDTATIDPWFLAGLLSSRAVGHQAARLSSTLGEHIRFDPRRVRILLLPISAQHEYGEVFRKLSEFTQALRSTCDEGIDLMRDMTDSVVAALGERTAGRSR